MLIDKNRFSAIVGKALNDEETKLVLETQLNKEISDFERDIFFLSDAREHANPADCEFDFFNLFKILPFSDDEQLILNAIIDSIKTIRKNNHQVRYSFPEMTAALNNFSDFINDHLYNVTLLISIDIYRYDDKLICFILRKLLEKKCLYKITFIIDYRISSSFPDEIENKCNKLYSYMRLCTNLKLWHKANIIIDEMFRNIKNITDPLLRGNIFFYAGMTATRFGRYNTAKKYYSESVVHYEICGNREQLPKSLNNLGNMYMKTGNPERAKKFFIRALSIIEDSQDNFLLAVSYGNMSNVNLARSEPEQAIAHLKKSLLFTARSGYYDTANVTYGYLGEAYQMKGDYDSARDYFKAALKFSKLVNSSFDEAHNLVRLISLDIKSGVFSDTAELISQAEEIYFNNENIYGLALIQKLKAEYEELKYKKPD